MFYGLDCFIGTVNGHTPPLSAVSLLGLLPALSEKEKV